MTESTFPIISFCKLDARSPTIGHQPTAFRCSCSQVGVWDGCSSHSNKRSPQIVGQRSPMSQTNIPACKQNANTLPISVHLQLLRAQRDEQLGFSWRVKCSNKQSKVYSRFTTLINKASIPPSATINQSIKAFIAPPGCIGREQDSACNSGPESISPIDSSYIQFLGRLLPDHGVTSSSVILFCFPPMNPTQVKACRVMLSTGLRRMWPIHLQCLCRIFSSTGIWQLQATGHQGFFLDSCWQRSVSRRSLQPSTTLLRKSLDTCIENPDLVFRERTLKFQIFFSWRKAKILPPFGRNLKGWFWIPHFEDLRSVRGQELHQPKTHPRLSNISE